MPHQSENSNFRAKPGRVRGNAGASNFGRATARRVRGIGAIGIQPIGTKPSLRRRKKRLLRSI